MSTDPFTDPQQIRALLRTHWEDLLEATQDGVLIVDVTGRIVYCNRVSEELLGYARGELTGQMVERLVPPLLRGAHGLKRERYVAEPYAWRMSNALDQVALRKDGSEVPVEISLSPLQTELGALLVAVVRDQTEQRQAQQLRASVATLDPLTGLANKVLFQDRLQQAIQDAQLYKRQVAVALLDLDHFKRVNESFGPGRGDAILLRVAERLKARMSEQATLARFRGDEFILVLRDLKDVHEAAKAAQDLLKALEEPFELEGREFTLTASVGISIYPNDGTDAETLIQHAETAMYRAKQERNSYQHFAHDTMSQVAERLTLENDLRKAIEHGELLIHYQPQVQPSDGQIVGAEALIRWNHPQRGLVSPMDFIPLAEETGLIVPITDWVLATAAAQAKCWLQAGHPPIRMAVNLSARHFKDLRLIDTVRDLMTQGLLEPQYLDLELTESLLMENLDVAITLLEELSALGVRLSIDDFGTGYSSLSYLKKLPIHTLKIDRCFIRDLSTDRSSAAIVRAIIDLAHHLDLLVVAEGVEDAQQREQLRELGCDQIQGYFYSRPLPADAFEDLLARDPFRRTLAEH